MKAEDELWLIWSNEHKAWWGQNHRGYVFRRDDAGRYLYVEALEIVCCANLGLEGSPNESMVMAKQIPDDVSRAG